MLTIQECHREVATHFVCGVDHWLRGVLSYHPDEFNAHRRKQEIIKLGGNVKVGKLEPNIEFLNVVHEYEDMVGYFMYEI